MSPVICSRTQSQLSLVAPIHVVPLLKKLHQPFAAHDGMRNWLTFRILGSFPFPSQIPAVHIHSTKPNTLNGSRSAKGVFTIEERPSVISNHLTSVVFIRLRVIA